MIVSADCGERIPTTAKSLVFFITHFLVPCFSKRKFSEQRRLFVNRCRVEEFSSIVAGEAKYGENTTGEVKKSKTYVKTVTKCISMEHSTKNG
jgi:hypothetical protein